MKKIVNPVAYRIGYNLLWNSQWYEKRLSNFSHFLKHDLLINIFLEKILKSIFYTKDNFFTSIILKTQIINNNKEKTVIIKTMNLQTPFFIIPFVQHLLINKKKNDEIKKEFYNNEFQLNFHYIKNKRLINLYVKKILKISYFIFWYYWFSPLFIKIKKIIKQNLAKLFKNQYKFNVFYFGYGLSYSSSIITHIIKKQLAANFSPYSILNEIKHSLRFPMQNGLICGIKIVIDGRFQRRGRSKCVWIQQGPVKNSNRNLKVDFSIDNYIGRYSIIGIKVWLLKSYLKNNQLNFWI